MPATPPSKRSRRCACRARPATARMRALLLRGRALRSARFSPSLILEYGLKQPAHGCGKSERGDLLARAPAAIGCVGDARLLDARDQQRRHVEMIVAERVSEGR